MMTGFNKDKVVKELVQCLDVSLCKLHQIWSEIGICESQRQERSNMVMLHLQNLLEEMVQEEETLKSQIMKRIEKYSNEVIELCKDLGLPEFEQKKHVSMLQTEKDLRAKVDALVSEKQERLKTLKRLKDQDQVLCDSLCLTPYYVPSGITPSREQLVALEKHVASLKTEKEKRFSEFVDKKKKIVQLFSDTERDPGTDFERDVACEDDESFVLSTENMKSLKVLLSELEDLKGDLSREVTGLWDRVTMLWDRLCISEEERTSFKEGKSGLKASVIKQLKEEIARCEQLKFENIQRFVEGMRKELVQWWDKCYYSKQQRDEFLPFTDENYTENLLEEHDKEVLQLKKYYEKHQQMFENVDRWETFFRQMIEMEKKANDPNRFNNRGGSLLQEEKARKKLLKDLPKVEEEVKDSILAWETQNGKEFLVEGVRFIDYIEKQWAVYEEHKVKEKEQRHKAKAKLMEEEMIFGSKPTTPAKRRFIGTPTKTPSKLRKLDDGSRISLQVRLKVKLNDTNKTPMSCSRMTQNSVFNSPHARAPMSERKHTSIMAKNTPRRRSLRGNRKALAERNTGPTNETLFSHTTVSGSAQPCVKVGGNASLASMGSYQEFEHGINQSTKPNCRSSIMPPLSPGKKV